MSSDQRPVLKVLTDMTASSLETTSLGARELMLVRLAAMAAVGAPPASYLLNAGPAADSGITLEDLRGVLAGVAPIIGTTHVVGAAGNLARAFAFAAELADEVGASEDGASGT
jgi:hypothetical protein